MYGQFVATKRLNNSVNSNPRYDVTVLSDGNYSVHTTSSDAAVGYDVDNLVRSGELVEIHLTRANRISHITKV